MPTGIRVCAEKRAQHLQTPTFRRAGQGSARGIEWIEVVTAHRDGRPAGSEIVRLYVWMGRDDLDGEPAPPAAVMAAIGLAIGQAVAQGFEDISQTRREDAGRIT